MKLLVAIFKKRPDDYMLRFAPNSMTRTLANSGIVSALSRSLMQLVNPIATLRSWLKTGMLVLLTGLLISVTLLGWTNEVMALPPGNAITEGKALLRYSLPIDNQPVRDLQRSLEDMTDVLRGRRKISSLNRNISSASRILDYKQDELLAPVPADRQPQAQALIAELQTGIQNLRQAVDANDKEAVRVERSKLLNLVGDLEELMVTQMPFEVPDQYRNLPQLKGRATVEIETTKGTLKAVVDGYNAPITAGNFVDLVQRGFYDGLEFTRVEEFYVAQVGDPPGAEDGFVDPKTGDYRSIPLEILVEGEDKPLYGMTFEEAGRYLDQPVLPFSAFGTLGMARPGNDPNGGSSQFFFFLFEPELTPAGLNLLDGRYAAFGYVVENKEVLDQIRVGDKIISARVLTGLENLAEP